MNLDKQSFLKEHPLVDYQLSADEPVFWRHECEDNGQRFAIIFNDKDQLIDLVEVAMDATKEQIADALLQKYNNLV